MKTVLSFLALLSIAAAPAGAQLRRVPVATHQIARGATLTASDIELRDSTMRSGAPIDTTDVVPGWVTRRVITAGEILRAPAVEPPNLVTANQSVAVEWVDQNIHLTLRGTATRNAAIGTRVTVRMESGRRVDGTVVGAGRVRID